MPGAMSGHPFLYDMYIMNRILIIILLLTCTVSHAQPPETVQHLGSTITTYGRKIISDKGSIWLTGGKTASQANSLYTRQASININPWGKCPVQCPGIPFFMTCIS